MTGNVKPFFTLLITAIVLLNSCKDDEPDALEIVTILASGTDLSSQNVQADLNAATAAESVPLNATISITFSEDVDPNTVNNSSVILSQNGTVVSYDLTVDGAVVTMDAADNFSRGTEYLIELTSACTSLEGGALVAVTRNFGTEGVGEVTPPQAANQVAYFKFNNNAEATVGNFSTTVETATYAVDRHGQPNSSANFNGATADGNGQVIEVASTTPPISNSITISTWVKTDGSDYGDDVEGQRYIFGIAAERGYYVELFTEEGDQKVKYPTSHIQVSDDNNHTTWSVIKGIAGHIEWPQHQIVQDTYVGNVSDLFADNNWHHMVITFDAVSSLKTFYLDGQVIYQQNTSAMISDTCCGEITMGNMGIYDVGAEDLIETSLTFGFAASTTNKATGWADYASSLKTFKGQLDDFRIFNVALSEADVATLYSDESN